MPELNLHHIDQITSDVRSQEIGFSHLFHDLVDHICCDVEFQMQTGMSFEEAYKMVKGKIGARGLKIIQEETLYVVDNKYRKMKKLMKVSGVAGIEMLGLSVILKLLHLPLAGILLSLGAVVLSLLFLPSALTVLWKETKSGKKLLLFISAFITGGSFILGTLFKIQHWPGAGIVITIALVSGTLLFIPSLFMHLYRDPEKKNKRLIYFAAGVSVILFMAGFYFRLFHMSFAGWFIMAGSVVLFFIVFPWFTFIQWGTEKGVNARFIFIVIASVLIIIPGTLINLNLEGAKIEKTSEVENKRTSVELHKTHIQSFPGDSLVRVNPSDK